MTTDQLLFQCSPLRRPTANRKPRWNFKKANWIKYRILSDELLGKITECQDANKLNDEVVSAILNAITQSAPRGSRKFYKPFWNSDIEAAVNKRNTAREVLEDTSDPMDRAQYSKACAQVKLTVKAAKKDTWQKTTADLNLDHEGNKAWSL